MDPTTIKTDDRVLVSIDGNDWIARHFSHIDESGMYVCFSNGTTSWTQTSTQQWVYIKLPESE